MGVKVQRQVQHEVLQNWKLPVLNEAQGVHAGVCTGAPGEEQSMGTNVTLPLGGRRRVTCRSDSPGGWRGRRGGVCPAGWQAALSELEPGMFQTGSCPSLACSWRWAACSSRLRRGLVVLCAARGSAASRMGWAVCWLNPHLCCARLACGLTAALLHIWGWGTCGCPLNVRVLFGRWQGPHCRAGGRRLAENKAGHSRVLLSPYWL